MSVTVVTAEETPFELRPRHPVASRDSQPQPADLTTAGNLAPIAKIPRLKLILCGYSFFLSGVNDGSLGPLLPYILRSFNISTGQVAIIFACTFLGWILALPINPFLAGQLPFGVVLLLGAVLQLLGQCLRPWGPFALYSSSSFVFALGMALQDSHANTFVSSVKGAHRWLGFIHAGYALGLVVSPIIATAIASKRDSIGGVVSWRATYFIMIGLNVLNVTGTFAAFYDTMKNSPSPDVAAESERRSGLNLRDLKETMKSRFLWLISLSFFLQLGAMMTASGWVVEFLVRVRKGDLAKMGYVPTGCNAGILLGRLLLAEPIYRLGEQRCVLASFILILAFQLVFWLVPNIISSAVALSLMGFFSGPFFPVGISLSSRVFPRKTRSTALGFLFVLAQGGGTFFPSLTGLIAESAGVAVLQPIVTGLLVLGGMVWWFLPKVPDVVQDEE